MVGSGSWAALDMGGVSLILMKKRGTFSGITLIYEYIVNNSLQLFKKSRTLSEH